MYTNVSILCFGLLFIGLGAQSTTEDEEEAPKRCYQFTWLGHRYNNNSIYQNATCEDATRLAEGVPCRHPLVVSYDGSWPDVDYIWTHYLINASCILAANDVCAKYTFYFNGVAENATYMCTQAVDTGGHAITSGCYEQVEGSSRTQVCFCQSEAGGVPCNRALMTKTSIVLFVFAILTALFYA